MPIKGAASISQMKTIAGHNLKPTPWHGFQLKHFDNSTERIFRCSFLTPCTSFLDWSGAAGRQRAVAVEVDDPKSPPECPFVFRWIHEDLAPWAGSGISAADVAAAKGHAAMRVLIVGGRLYVDLYYACVETRAAFTLWGLLQLLRRFPGEVPDVDFMFDCMDRPVIPRSLRRSSPPPPLFRYSTTPGHYDISFPDWSFWGWYAFYKLEVCS